MVYKNPPIRQYAIHHTAVSRTQNPIQLFAVNRYHQKTSPYNYLGKPSSLGWWVAYNYFIDVDGTVTNTRAVGEETIANKGYNCDVYERCTTISICLAGDFNRELPTDAQRVALQKLIFALKREFVGITYTFHRDLQTGRTCPGRLFTETYFMSSVLNLPTEAADDIEKRKRQLMEKKLRDALIALIHKLRLKLYGRS